MAGKKDDRTDGTAQSPAPPAAQTSPDQHKIDEARDSWLILTATAEGYRQSVRNLEQMQVLLDILGLTTAVGLVAALWGIKELIPQSDYQVWISNLVNVVGTLLAIALACLTALSWRQEWRGKTENGRQLANQADRLAARYYDIFQASNLDHARLAKANQDRLSFASEENQTLGGIPKWARWRGFQHVGRKFPIQNVRCHSCRRNWEELRLLQGARFRPIIKGRCETCGVCR